MQAKGLRILLVVLMGISLVTLAMAKTVTKDGIELPISATPVTYTWMLGIIPTSV